MPDKEVVQAVLDAIGVTRVGRNEARNNRCDNEADCAAPELVVYIVITNCVTINNGACEDWKFCEDRNGCPRQ